MALQQIAGPGPAYTYGEALGSPNFVTTAIAATGDQYCWIGRVFLPGRGTKNLTRFGFRVGTVVSAGGSGMIFSTYALATAAGPPAQPTGAAIKSTPSINVNTISTNSWVRTSALGSAVSVTHGDTICVVGEYDGGGRLGSDSVQFSALGNTSAAIDWMQGISVSKITGTFTALAVYPNIMLEMDDGTWGTIEGALPCSALNTHSHNSGSSPNEHALAFQLAHAGKIDGGRIQAQFSGASAAATLNLYDGTSVIGSSAIDAHQIVASAAGRPVRNPFGAETAALTVSHQYYLTLSPTTANNISLYSVDVNDANHFTCWPGGINFNYSNRSGGSWAAVTTTRRLLAGFNLSSLDDGTGGGGSTGGFIIGGN